MMDWLFEVGCDRVWLGTGPATRAADFYAAAGWTRAGGPPDGELRFEMSRERWLARRR